MVMERVIRLPATAGGAGVSTATGQTESPVRGDLLGIAFSRTGTAIPATTDITVDEVGGANRRLLTLTDLAADPGVYYPLTQEHDELGAAIAGIYSRFYIPGYYLKVTIAQADDGAILVCRLWLFDVEKRVIAI